MSDKQNLVDTQANNENIDHKENISMEITAKQETSKEDQKKFEKEVQKRVEEKYDEKNDQIKNNQNQNQNQKVQLTLENLLNIKAILEAAIQRNVFKQEEMKDVLGNYEFFVKGLQTLIESQKR